MLDSLTAREKVQAIYIAYLISIVVIPLAIVGVFFAYKLKREHQGSWLETHCDWQIKTFWIGLVGTILVFVASFIFLGGAVWLVTGLLFLYRVIKGWLKLSENHTVEPKAYGLI